LRRRPKWLMSEKPQPAANSVTVRWAWSGSMRALWQRSSRRDWRARCRTTPPFPRTGTGAFARVISPPSVRDGGAALPGRGADGRLGLCRGCQPDPRRCQQAALAGRF
jgi:hypothetical protein